MIAIENEIAKRNEFSSADAATALAGFQYERRLWMQLTAPTRLQDQGDRSRGPPPLLTTIVDVGLEGGETTQRFRFLFQTIDFQKSLSVQAVTSGASSRLLGTWWGSDEAAANFLKEPFNADTVHVGAEALGRTFAKLRPAWCLGSRGLRPPAAELIALLANDTITSLDLSSNYLANRGSDLFGVRALCTAIKTGRLTALTECRLCGNLLGEEGWCCFFGALLDTPSNRIDVIDLRGEHLTLRTIQALAACIGNSAALCDIKLKDAKVDAGGWKCLLTTLGSTPGTRFASWDFSGQDLDDGKAALLATYIKKSACLTSLNLSNTQLSPKGGTIIGHSVRASCSMETITMEEGILMPVKQLKGAVDQGRPEEVVSMEGWGLGPLSLSVLAWLVVENHHLSQVRHKKPKLRPKPKPTPTLKPKVL